MWQGIAQATWAAQPAAEAKSRLRDVGAVGGSDIRGAAEGGPDGGHQLLVPLTIFGALTRTDETLRLSHNSMGEQPARDGAFCD